MSNDAMRCPDAECLSAFLDGAVAPAELASVKAHLSVCADCREVVGLSAYAAEVIASEPVQAVRPRQQRWARSLSAAAAAITAIAVLVVSYRSWTPREPRQLLVDAASGERRYVEPRLTGGFPWAPLATASRGSEPLHPDRMRLIGAAGTVLERTEGDDSSKARHAAALAQLLAERPAEAARLLSKLAPSTSDAEIWCDLAAASYTTALQRSDRAKAAEALAAANFALRLRPAMPEALFNRALILEFLGLENEAREAWDRYLAVEPHGAWAAEARERRARLAPSASQGGEMRAHSALLAAARDPGNRSGVRTQLLAAARDAAYEGRWSTSLYLLGLELDALLDSGDASRVAETLLMRARIALHIGHDAMARADADLAAEAIARIRDDGERERAETSRQVIAGAVEKRPAAAVQLLSRLIARGHRSHLPEMYLHRGHALEQLRRLDDAAADYEAGISRVGWDRSWDRAITRDELHDAAIALAVSRGDASGAFAHSERSRGGRPDLELAVPRDHLPARLGALAFFVIADPRDGLRRQIRIRSRHRVMSDMKSDPGAHQKRLRDARGVAGRQQRVELESQEIETRAPPSFVCGIASGCEELRPDVRPVPGIACSRQEGRMRSHLAVQRGRRRETCSPNARLGCP
ncbi:MAG TPA: zf-HC2 domain-containing protein, partial [Thermoanaerobaculia bacterium]|nr:zf-HC2 domain-containing protein [Thermoanaerobaculia bacterium]